MVARWIPATAESAWEHLCAQAGVTIRNVDAATYSYFVQLPTGPLFLIAGWPTGRAREGILCYVWCQWALHTYGPAFIGGAMRHMVTDSRAIARADEVA